jgi:hypothetical protein
MLKRPKHSKNEVVAHKEEEKEEKKEVEEEEEKDGEENSFAPTGIRAPDRPVRSLVAKPTVLLRLPRIKQMCFDWIPVARGKVML